MPSTARSSARTARLKRPLSPPATAVRQAVAVGRPDARLGERVVAFVVTSAPFDLTECRTWFAARGVTKFKWPEEIVLLDALPTMAAGKPDRAALAARARTSPTVL